MLRINRKIVAVLVVIVIISAFTIPSSADSGYASRDMNGSYSFTQFNSSCWGQSNFWDVWWGYNGTSCTKWMGSTPYYADSIVHNDILRCTGIGSMSIGCSLSGPNGSATVSNHSATFNYWLEDEYQLNVNYEYMLTGLWDAWNFSMGTSAVVKLGTNFYPFHTT